MIKPSFEDNFKILKSIAEELSNSDLSLDDLLEKGELAEHTAKKCLKILKDHKAKFIKIENELEKLSLEINNFTEEESENE